MRSPGPRGRFEDWLCRYENAWRTAGVESLGQLFTESATYLPAPFDEPLRGLGEIAVFWEAERESADEEFSMSSELLAAEGDVAVVRVEVRYRSPRERVYRDLWVVTLCADGRASAFEEWPFFPDRERTAPSAS